MSKKLYIFFLFLIFSSFWDIRPFGELSSDIWFLIQFGYLLYGWFHYKNPEVNLRCKALNPFWVIVVGILLSMIPAELYYGQPISQSFVTYRAQFMWFVIPVLLKVKPSFEEIAKAITWVAAFLLPVAVLKMTSPEMFYFAEKTLERMQTTDYDAIQSIGAVSFVTIPIFYYLQKMHDKFELKHLYMVMFLIIVIFLIQNRSTLFPMVLIIGYSIFRIKSSKKPIIVVMAAVVAAVAISQTMDTWLDLLDETTVQLENEDYNRNKAIAYFFSPLANPSSLTYFLGNGYLSSHYTTLMQDLMALGVFNSDMGLIGFWNQFGLIPIIVFIVMYIKPWIEFRTSPYGLRLYALFLIAISFTTGYFGVPIHMLFFAFYYYLYMYYKSCDDVVDTIQ